ncbi:hypothetical protein JCM11641_005889 [Rhodosporidiobolus odoratus]
MNMSRGGLKASSRPPINASTPAPSPSTRFAPKPGSPRPFAIPPTTTRFSIAGATRTRTPFVGNPTAGGGGASSQPQEMMGVRRASPGLKGTKEQKHPRKKQKETEESGAPSSGEIMPPPSFGLDGKATKNGRKGTKPEQVDAATAPQQQVISTESVVQEIVQFDTRGLGSTPAPPPSQETKFRRSPSIDEAASAYGLGEESEDGCDEDDDDFLVRREERAESEAPFGETQEEDEGRQRGETSSPAPFRGDPFEQRYSGHGDGSSPLALSRESSVVPGYLDEGEGGDFHQAFSGADAGDDFGDDSGYAGSPNYHSQEKDIGTGSGGGSDADGDKHMQGERGQKRAREESTNEEKLQDEEERQLKRQETGDSSFSSTFPHSMLLGLTAARQAGLPTPSTARYPRGSETPTSTSVSRFPVHPADATKQDPLASLDSLYPDEQRPFSAHAKALDERQKEVTVLNEEFDPANWEEAGKVFVEDFTGAVKRMSGLLETGRARHLSFQKTLSSHAAVLSDTADKLKETKKRLGEWGGMVLSARTGDFQEGANGARVEGAGTAVQPNGVAGD